MAMAKTLSAALAPLFLTEPDLPASSMVNVARRLNLFNDPVVTLTLKASTATGVTGTYGAEATVQIAGTGTTAVASVEPREDGFGNNVAATAILAGDPAASYVRIRPSRTEQFTVEQDCALVAMFSGYIEAAPDANITKQQIQYNFTLNGNVKTFTLLEMTAEGATRLDNGWFAIKGAPIYLKAGDSISGTQAMAFSVFGNGEVTIKQGRYAVRIIPESEFVM